MVSVVAPVHVLPLLAANVSVCEPVPKAKVEFAERSRIEPTVSPKPVVAPVRNVPPLNQMLPASAKVVAEPSVKVPAVRIVPPVYKFVPESNNVLAPIFSKLPVEEGTAPDIVNVFVVTSIAAEAPLEIVKALSVEAADPVYRKVPFPRTKLVAAFDAWPRFPATPPFPIVATLNIPALIVVAPVKVFTPDKVKTPPVPVLVKAFEVPPLIIELIVIPPVPSVLIILLVVLLSTNPIAPF